MAPKAGTPHQPIGPAAAPVPAGDRDAFAELVRREGGRLLATARRITDSEADAYDCVQEAFLRAHRHLDQFDGHARLSTWLYRILVNAALEKVRKRSRKSEISLDELMPAFDERDCRLEPKGPAPPDAEILLQREQTREAVRDAIAHLPASHREILVLRDIQGHSTAETAHELDLTEGAVRVRLHRARAALKRLLEPVMGVHGEVERG